MPFLLTLINRLSETKSIIFNFCRFAHFLERSVFNDYLFVQVHVHLTQLPSLYLFAWCFAVDYSSLDYLR